MSDPLLDMLNGTSGAPSPEPYRMTITGTSTSVPSKPDTTDPLLSLVGTGEAAPTQATPEPAAPGKMGLEGDGYKAAMNYDGTNATLGALRGAGSIGASILRMLPTATQPLNASSTPIQGIKGDGYDQAMNYSGVGDNAQQNSDRRTAMDAGSTALGADPNSMPFKTAKLGAEIAGTAGTGGLLAKGVGAILPAAMQALPWVPKLLSSLQSGGFSLGGAPATSALGGVGNAAIRAIGGSAVGAGSAGLVNPEDAVTGAKIGAVLPVGANAIGAAFNATGRALGGPALSPEVATLAKKAADYGINIPADRLTNSKPLNALASSLNYVPFSGRQAVESGMQTQINQALSKTVGQNTPNLNEALNQARPVLGAQFDTALQNNSVNMTPKFLNDLSDAANMAEKELGADGKNVILGQIKEIMDKSASGQMEGQAAYNIKKTLDRIGNRITPEAYYAKNLKGSLMDALNASMSPADAAAFATTRKQYGNMLALDKLAPNGAEGNIPIARLANMKNIHSQELQDLADISAQFLKSREGAHGSMQRAMVGGLSLGQLGGAAGFAAGGQVGAGIGYAGGLIGGGLLGRGANSALNSNWARAAVLGQPSAPGLLSNSVRIPMVYGGLLTDQSR